MRLQWVAVTLMSYACATAQVTENDQFVMAIAFQQKAAEYRALCYQAYNAARRQIEFDVATVKTDKPRAVILDIDETVLDNSPFAVRLIRQGGAYPKGWSEWVDEAKAIPVPGALEFLKWADSNGVKIFYISNRDRRLGEATMKNLAALGFPQCSNEHVLLKTEGSGKESRRQHVTAGHRVVLLVGDNLNDFSEVFEKKDVENRFMETDRWRDAWGSKFIVLPNPGYGDWEGALFDYNWNLSIEEKNKIRKAVLRDR